MSKLHFVRRQFLSFVNNDHPEKRKETGGLISESTHTLSRPAATQNGCTKSQGLEQIDASNVPRQRDIMADSALTFIYAFGVIKRHAYLVWEQYEYITQKAYYLNKRDVHGCPDSKENLKSLSKNVSVDVETSLFSFFHWVLLPFN